MTLTANTAGAVLTNSPCSSQVSVLNDSPEIGLYYSKMLVIPVIFLSAIYSVSGGAKCTTNAVLQTYSIPVSLRGRLAYHSYISYGDGSSNLFLKDFRSNILVQLNQDFWNIEDPINPHFSPNGRYITFMGKQNSRWNIFIWKVGGILTPVNLSNNTQEIDGRSEDPKFSLNGNYIVYKNNNDIVLIRLNFSKPETPFADGFWKITKNGYLTEESMPYLSSDGKSIFYSQGAGATSDIYQISFKIKANTLFSDRPSLVSGKRGLAEYYPIVQNKSLFFVGWKDSVSRNDQIYAFPNLEHSYQPAGLSLNDCNTNNSDPIFVDASHIIFSSTRNGKFYNLYIGNIYTGKVWSLDKYGVNEPLKHQLGATYTNAR
jgi:Tol biopolymer transport system component